MADAAAGAFPARENSALELRYQIKAPPPMTMVKTRRVTSSPRQDFMDGVLTLSSGGSQREIVALGSRPPPVFDMRITPAQAESWEKVWLVIMSTAVRERKTESASARLRCEWFPNHGESAA
jgi:hypothetical protein